MHAPPPPLPPHTHPPPLNSASVHASAPKLYLRAHEAMESFWHRLRGQDNASVLLAVQAPCLFVSLSVCLSVSTPNGTPPSAVAGR
jgi:hypothetical protein